jgi:hypothetical protein
MKKFPLSLISIIFLLLELKVEVEDEAKKYQ